MLVVLCNRQKIRCGRQGNPSSVANGRILSDNSDVDLTDRRYTASPSSVVNGRVLSDNNNRDLTDRRYTGRQGDPQLYSQWECSVGQK